MAKATRKAARAAHRGRTGARTKAARRSQPLSREKIRSNGGAHATERRPVRAVAVPHIETPPVDPARVVESKPLPRALGAGMAVENLLKLLARVPPGGTLRLAGERNVRRPHPEGLDDYTERKWGGKQRGIHLVIRDWETNYRGHVSNGTNVDIRAWGFPDGAGVHYWEREQWAIGEAPFRRAGVSVEGGNKRLLETVLKSFGQEENAVG